MVAFINKLCSLNCNYSVPKRKKIKKVVKFLADDQREKVKKSFENIENVAVTTDYWTSVKQKIGYVGLTVHFFEGFALKSVSLGVKRIIGSHTADNIKEVLLNFFESFGILNKVVSITGDNAANLRLAAEKLKIKFYGCFAHTLNLIVQNALKNLNVSSELNCEEEDSIYSTLEKCRKQVGLFSHSTKLNDALDKEENSNNTKVSLKQDVVTR